MLVKIKGMNGFSSRLLIGMVLGVGMISTLEGQKAKQINEEYQREQNEQHKQFMENMNKSLSYVAYTKDSFDGTETSKTNMNKFYYTNVFGPNDNTSVTSIADGDNNSAIIHSSPNTYKQNVASSADSTNFLETNLFGDDTVFYDEEAVKDELIQRSYKNMKEQAKQMYSDRIKENIYVWPDAITTYYTDMWGRDFEYTKTADNIAQLAFTPPWTGSTKLILPINLPEPAVEEVVENPYPIFHGGCYSVCDNFKILFENGDLWGIGGNGSGELGLGHSNYVSSWTKIADNVKSLEDDLSTDRTSFIIKNDGSLWGAGNNKDGQLGTGNTTASTSWIKLLDNIERVSTLSYMGTSFLTFTFSTAVDSDKNLWVTGDNYYGRLGLGHTNTVKTWTNAFSNLDIFTFKVNSYWNLMFITESDEFVGAGAAYGIGTATNIFTILKNDIKDIDVIPWGAFVLTNNSELWGHGLNASGELGLGHANAVSGIVKILDGVDELVPEINAIKIGNDLYTVDPSTMLWAKSVTNFEKGFPGTYYTVMGDSFLDYFATDKDGNTWARGGNYGGELGLGHTNVVDAYTITPISDVKDIRLIKVVFVDPIYKGTAIALKNNGEVWGAGYNSTGELGLGHSSAVTTWQKLNIDNVKKILYANSLQGLVAVEKNNGEIWAIGKSFADPPLAASAPHTDWYMVFDASGNPVAEP